MVETIAIEKITLYDLERRFNLGVTHCQKSEDVLDDQKTVPFL
jgi:hypothetical protein